MGAPFNRYHRIKLILILFGGLYGVVVHVVYAAPHQQVPVVGPDAVTTPALAVTVVLLPTAEPTVTEVAYHEQMGEQTYRVQPGDTLLAVALETGVDLALLPCAIAPDFQPNQPLVIGDTLTIPDATVRCHTTAGNETLNALAARYQVTPALITAVAWNQLPQVDGDFILPNGRNIRIPPSQLAGAGLDGSTQSSAPTEGSDATSFLTWMLEQPPDTSPFLALAVGGPFANRPNLSKPDGSRAVTPANQPGAVPENWPYGSGNFAWPLTGWLTQGYRYDHRALDIAAPYGTTVTAADRGVVLRAGWNDQGYGLFVIIDHNIDYISLYAHLSEILVKEGDVVAQGEVIGKVGSTGNSTGPHLHFEIRDFGRLTNPLELLVH